MDNDDVVLWADGTWCFGHEFHEYTFMSDDFKILKEYTDEYEEFFKEFE